MVLAVTMYGEHSIRDLAEQKHVTLRDGAAYFRFSLRFPFWPLFAIDSLSLAVWHLLTRDGNNPCTIANSSLNGPMENSPQPSLESENS